VHGDYQSKLTLMSESLRNDGRIWVPKKKEDVEALREGRMNPRDIAEEDRDYYLERRYPAFGNLVPRDVASRAAKERCDEGYGVGSGLAVYLDFAESLGRLGKHVIEERYGNLFQMYEKIVDQNPYENPMMIYPAIHYCMGGIWVDYELMTTIPGLFSIGECNFSDHGANRLGASALMQGLADGYFILPYTIQNYLSADIQTPRMPTTLPGFSETEEQVHSRLNKLMQIKGEISVDHIHKKSGNLLWEMVGMARNKEGLKQALGEFVKIKQEFWNNVRIPGKSDEMNPELEKAARVADFIEIGELMSRDALQREESCGGHFREEFQTPEGEASRNDDDFMFVGAWEYKGEGNDPIMHKEELHYESIKVQTRNYKI
jgi:succinate dehydrogenase / fumarate reductase flavoprotein subunit